MVYERRENIRILRVLSLISTFLCPFNMLFKTTSKNFSDSNKKERNLVSKKFEKFGFKEIWFQRNLVSKKFGFFIFLKAFIQKQRS